ncbi:MAG: GAF domain-containing protein [Candidatus Omnitrophica bacterium]|jgi:signal transduction protein with GAF and PtsI domain|nr:GAF domain-containing protein [Candidatus Omnitrophota bacterium]
MEEKKRKINFWEQIFLAYIESKNLQDFAHSFISIISSIMKAEGGYIYLLDREKNILNLFASKNPYPDLIGKLSFSSSEGLTGWIATNKKILAIEKNCYNDERFKPIDKLNEDTYESYIGAPIKKDNEVIGVLSVKKRRVHQWLKKDIEFMEVAGNIAGKIFEKYQNMEELEKKAHKLENIGQISKTIISGKYLQEILNLIVSLTAEATGSKICSIMLLNAKVNELEIKASQSLSPEYLNKANLKINASISGKALLEKRPIIVLDVTKESLYQYPEIAKKEGLVSLLAVPMILKGKSIGVINSYTDYPHNFTEEEIDHLLTVAAQAAIAIENTKLMEEKIAIEEALETRKIVEKAKGILMKTKNLSEEASYRFIQKQAMDKRKSMKEVAEAIILSVELEK